MLGCLLHTPPQPRVLIRSWALRSGVVDQNPPSAFLFPRPVQISALSALADSQTEEVWDPLPDLPISSQRNSTNEALWGTDAERAAWAKTTCHSHLMITHTVMSQGVVCFCVFMWMRSRICFWWILGPCVRINLQTVFTHPQFDLFFLLMTHSIHYFFLSSGSKSIFWLVVCGRKWRCTVRLYFQSLVTN